MSHVLFIDLRRTHLHYPEERLFYDAYWRRLTRAVSLQTSHSITNYDIPEPPYWVLHLGAVLRDASIPWAVRTLEVAGPPYSNAVLHDLVRALDTYVTTLSPAIVAFSPLTVTYPVLRHLLTHLTSAFPRLHILVGGPHATFLDRECLQDGADLVVRGEYDSHFAPLVSALLSNRRPLHLPSLSLMNDGELLRTPQASDHANMATLPVPCFDAFATRAPKLPYIRLFTQRGCPFRCAFCANTLWNNAPPRAKPLSLVADEIQLSFEAYGRKPLFVADETFTLDADRARAVAVLFGNAGVPWFAQTRADYCDLSVLGVLADHGCRLLSIGAETQSASILRRIRKGYSGNALLAACQAARSVGLSVLTYWLIGLPGETRNTVCRTQEAIVHLLMTGLSDVVEYFICVPYPGTPIYDNPARYGVTISKAQWELFREDGDSCTATHDLGPQQICSMWREGLARIAGAMQG